MPHPLDQAESGEARGELQFARFTVPKEITVVTPQARLLVRNELT